jgi:hypothetical protein
MKPLWTQTLVWIAAVLMALLLAFAGPDGLNAFDIDSLLPHGADTPR